MTHAYDAFTPAGALFCGQCTAGGHAHDNPDVPLRIPCPLHATECWWCGGCGEIWCPEQHGQDQPHQLKLTPV